MNANLWKIGTQLKVGFLLILIFVALLGYNAHVQTDKIYDHIEAFYNHPMQVRQAIARLQSDVLSIQIDMRNALLNVNDSIIENAKSDIKVEEADAYSQIDTLEHKYLGPKEDIKAIRRAFIDWKARRDKYIDNLKIENIEKVSLSLLPSGQIGQAREKLLKCIEVVDKFASNKAASLFAKSEQEKDQLNNQSLVITLFMLLLASIIYFILLRNIKKPINELISASDNFTKGDLDARCQYASTNEFGILAKSFNQLVSSIQQNFNLNQKISHLSDKMLSENNSNSFFSTTLQALAETTHSQMAVVYIENQDKKCFEHLFSYGLMAGARKSFSIEALEGQLGHVVNSRKIQRIKRIPKESIFTFGTIAGDFVPREIVSIPINADKRTIAVISLASLRSYDEESILLIEKIKDTLSARIEGVLAYQKIHKFSSDLEQRNKELDAQKSELSSQAAELSEQNTELEAQKNQLREASQLKTNFLSNMSHELRTPLNSVIALSGVLSRRLAKQIPDEEHSYIEVIERNGKHLLSLINDILDISRIEAGKEEIDISKFDANDLIADVVGMILPQATQKEIIIKHVDRQTLRAIQTDLGKCRHILQNLIGNAVKFTEKGEVSISCNSKNDRIIIEVKDSGIGIDEQHLSHIFDEFRQADGSTSRRFGGTGLGLAIAKKYANLLGGTVTVESELGKGSTFTLSLPAIYAAENKIEDSGRFVQHKLIATNTTPVTNAQPKGDKTILLVDDSEPAIIQMKDVLEENGYQILIARNGKDALSLISEITPDAIILDLMMPDVDGFDVLNNLRSTPKTALIPVLILTAKQITKDDLKRLNNNNIHQLIQKGDVNLTELIESIDKMISPNITEAAPVKQSSTPRLKNDATPVILIVEDNPDNMITVKAVLGEKFKIIEATDGKQGIEFAKKYKPDLILMDIALPDLDGIEAFHAIRKDVKLQLIPIIALTASAMTSDRETILSHGFDAYIAKPIDETQFFKTIHQTLYA